jgi:replicative DNA helicase
MSKNYEMQDACLGLILADAKKNWLVAERYGFSPDMFGSIERIKLAGAIAQLARAGVPLSKPAIIDLAGGECVAAFMAIVRTTPLGQNFDWYMGQVSRWFKLKKMMPLISSACLDALSASTSSPIEPVVSKLTSLVDALKELRPDNGSTVDMPEAVQSTLSRLEQRIEDRAAGKSRGIGTGLKALDKYISGLIGGRFYIIAARTSVGKTTFSAFLTLEAMKQGKWPLFFTNEMDAEDLVEKYLSSLARVSAGKVQDGVIGNDDLIKLTKAAENLMVMRSSFDPKAGWDLDHLISVIHKKHAEGQCDFVIVDYLQQVRVKGAKSTHEQVSRVSDEMKKISRDLNIPVIGLAQINRGSERSGKPEMPSLSHLKDSGSLEQDADVVMILHKDEKEGNVVELKVAKNRHGWTGKFSMNHIGEYHLYVEVDRVD